MNPLRLCHFGIVGTLTIGLANVAHATIRYVDSTAPTTGQTGSSTHPFVKIQDAVSLSSPDQTPPDEIHIGGGSVLSPKFYTPTPIYDASNPPQIVDSTPITLNSGVRVWGGYAGWNGSTFVDTRAPDTYITVLTGNFGGGAHAKSVVKVLADTQPPSTGTVADRVNLDGVTITGGAGGANDGGGIHIEDSDPDSTSVVFRKCVITGNTAANGAGVSVGIYAVATFRKCKFEDNTAAIGGGAVFSGEESNILLLDCRFDSNTAGFGGAVCLSKGPAVSILSCRFTNNVATGTSTGGGLGGAVRITTLATNTVANCLFVGNEAHEYGESHGHGGAIYGDSADNGAVCNVVNCTASGNSAYAGGALYFSNVGAGALNVKNSIFWGDTATTSPEIANVGTVVVSYSDIQNGSVWAGTENRNVDPMFDAAYHLQCITDCIDGGYDTAVLNDTLDVNEDTYTTALDLDLLSRIIGTCDMGAFEKRLPACFGDLDDDEAIDLNDLLIVLEHWGACTSPLFGCTGDLVGGVPCGDGLVDLDDLNGILDHWGTCSATEFPAAKVLEALEDCIDLYPAGGEAYAECVIAYFD